MKKQFIAGMMILSTTLSFSAYAAPTTKNGKGVRESLIEYKETVRKAVYGGKTSAKDLGAVEGRKVNDKLLTELNVSTAEKMSINSYIATSKNSPEITESLVGIAAAKKMVSGKTDAESVSINNAADASLKMMANASLIGQRKDSKVLNLNAAELKEASEALTKLSQLPDELITFEKADRDTFTTVINELNKNTSPSASIEEAFVSAIMKVKGIDKTKAMEIVRKIKERC